MYPAGGGAPAKIRPSGASRPYLRPARSIPLGVVHPLRYAPRGLPVLTCVQLAVSLWGVLHPLGYVPRRLPVLACVLLAVSRWVVLHPLGYASRGSFPHPPTHSPALRPPRLHFLQLCHLVIQSTRTTTFCKPNTRPRKCTSRSTRWDTSLEGFPSLLASCSQYLAGGTSPAGIHPSEAFPSLPVSSS